MIAPDNISIFYIILIYSHLKVMLEYLPHDGILSVVAIYDQFRMPDPNRLLFLRTCLSCRILSCVEITADGRCCGCSQLI